mmetsp:Transcript_125490/g.363077  ORF Transcript_125490/g.363077 Transcript_125490/m.363077 type:complete len:290 (-) Transcript_125490:26-895(-)
MFARRGAGVAHHAPPRSAQSSRYAPSSCASKSRLQTSCSSAMRDKAAFALSDRLALADLRFASALRRSASRAASRAAARPARNSAQSPRPCRSGLPQSSFRNASICSMTDGPSAEAALVAEATAACPDDEVSVFFKSVRAASDVSLRAAAALACLARSDCNFVTMSVAAVVVALVVPATSVTEAPGAREEVLSSMPKLRGVAAMSACRQAAKRRASAHRSDVGAVEFKLPGHHASPSTSASARKTLHNFTCERAWRRSAMPANQDMPPFPGVKVDASPIISLGAGERNM